MPRRTYGPNPERDDLAQSLAWSFYHRGHVYDASLDQVVKERWPEWREQAEDLLGIYPGLRQAIADKVAASIVAGSPRTALTEGAPHADPA